jgi:Skp family chaperone for outer membrane proteins
MDEVMFEVIGQLAAEQGYTLILRTDQLMLAADPLLITKTVVDRLNKKLPSLKVPDPTQPPPKQQ